ncbi:cellulose binding domain-containing protein [Micromonospora sp. WMMD1102]|uniref:cellulose binding domain-containing protein n=1 Tax=Micromonospora sp. WMMD1102 TaxID=3016105 RepID=UPI0024153D63|nr:cellulose binding domain-containing protein [Micromonospora sp. WMMD1102]MDG4786625.1 cellulose binding domain-containing protein [Micromonospora sp. WMMD1102]
MRRAGHRRRPTILVLTGAATAMGAMLVATALPSGAAPSPAAGTAASGAGVGVLAASAGCGKAPTLANGTHSIQSGGRTRTFVLRRPDNYDNNRPYRLVFGFHWLNGNAHSVVSGNYYGLLPLSNNSTIFVAPEGLNAGWANSGGEDVTFTDNMIQTITNALCVDTQQLYSLGFSYGGGMSYALACARSTVFRAVAIYSGGVISGCNGGTQPIAYLQAHGLGDNVLGISGARSMRDRFVANNRCNSASPPEPAQGSGRHTEFHYSGCAAGYPVAWYAFDGGHTPTPQDSGTNAYWLPQETWEFFTQFQSNPTPGPTNPTPGPTTPTPGPTTPGPTTPPPSSGACRVTSTVNAWNTGLTESITITNTGTSAVNGWSLVFTLPGGQTITSGWNASYSPASGQVTARNASYNAAIAPNASVSIGFQATHTGNTARPSSFTLNGAACTLA